MIQLITRGVKNSISPPPWGGGKKSKTQEEGKGRKKGRKRKRRRKREKGKEKGKGICGKKENSGKLERYGGGREGRR